MPEPSAWHRRHPDHPCGPSRPGPGEVTRHEWANRPVPDCSEVLAFARRRGDGVDAIWALSWPEQQAAGINPIVIRAYYSAAAHHPHLRAGTAGDWPLNVFDEKQAAAQVPALRAIASADLHNLVFQSDYRIIPAIVNGWTP